MKEKRYYCDWVLSKPDEESISLIKTRLFIPLIVVAVVSSIIYYNIMMHNHGERLFETYSESAYNYLDEIADNVIEKDGINVDAIPDDVVKYEITNKDDEIIFEYSIDNNKGKKFATSASMTVTLSKNFEILSKKPNYSSKEEYVQRHKMAFYIFVPMFGGLIAGGIGFASFILMAITIPISMVHKKKDMKKNLS